MVEGSPGKILSNVTVEQPDGPGANYGVGVAQIRFSFAQRFYFSPKQHHSRLMLLKEVIIV